MFSNIARRRDRLTPLYLAFHASIVRDGFGGIFKDQAGSSEPITCSLGRHQAAECRSGLRRTRSEHLGAVSGTSHVPDGPGWEI